MNTIGLENLFVQTAVKCYRNGNETACDISNDLITVFYDLNLGEKVQKLMELAVKESEFK